MALTKQQLALRGEIGASDVPTIVNGDAASLNALWRRKVGLEPEPDLSEEWAPMAGSYMEPFILDWHERKLGYKFEERGRVVRHPDLDYVSCTLDAFDRQRNAVVDAKCTAWSLEWARQFYTPQFYIQRACKHAGMMIMLISVAGREPIEVEIDYDADYYVEVIARIQAFKQCMESMTEPAPLPKLVAYEKLRTVNLEKDDTNYKAELIEHLEDWRATAEAHRVHEQAAASGKSLVPNDVGRLTYQEITITRNKKGHLSLRSRNDD